MASLDILDLSLIFWTVLAVGTYLLGNLLENLYKSKQQRGKSIGNHRSSLSSDQHNHQSTSGYHQSSNQDYYSDHSYQNHDVASQQKGLGSGQYNQDGSSLANRQPTNKYDFYTDYGSGYKRDSRGLNETYYPSDYPYELTTAISATSTHHQATLDRSPGQGASTSHQTIPTATGFSQDCVEWINKILYLFYSEPNKYLPIISDSLCRSLNEKLSNLQSSQPLFGTGNNSGAQANFQLVFRDVVREASSRPELTNVRTETESDKSVSTICKIYNRRLVLDLTATIAYSSQPADSQNQQPLASKASLYDGYDPHYNGQAYQEHQQQESILYELSLENLEGKLKSVSILQDKLIVVQFMEKPDCKMTLRPKYDTFQSMKQHQSINEDAIINLVMQTLTQVVVDLYFGDDPEFPRYHGHKMKSKQIKQDFFSVLTKSHIKTDHHHQQQQQHHHNKGDKEKKIFIKINKAVNINYNNSVHCLIEVDEPSQRSHTALKQGNDPVWDEHFIFNMNDKSNEMLFELWDGEPSAKKSQSERQRKGDKFLGMAIVSMEELQKNPVQKQTLALQSRPMQSDQIGGQLHVEFLFMEHSAQQQAASQYQKGDVVSVDRKVTPSGFVITTTTITKPDGTLADQPATSHQSSNKLDTLKSQRLSPNDENASFRAPSSLSSDTGVTSHLDEIEINVPSQGRRSRPTKRSDSILRAIKKRFSFSRTRSKSVEQRLGTATGTAASSPSVSRASSIGSTDRAKSVPASRGEPLPSIVIQPGRSSDAVSEITYSHPSSQLIIESDSDGILRHYVVPPSLANKSKWSRKGTKIHLFNDHQFIARHLSGPTTCHLCGRLFSRRPGKQGYMCRNCHVISHKQCHVKIDHMCPYGTRNTMILESYVDPANSKTTQQRRDNKKNQTDSSNTLSKARSISMDVEDER